ncbi:MAG: ornithine carbamoyltransferase [Desulfovibrionaceae bacterium]|jgi:ornithine carbamoyltransferase|nr:ornithine carbamoyltransferase [Desulfovibrionaceae bacterium]
MPRNFLRILDVDNDTAAALVARAIEMKKAAFRGATFAGKHAVLIFEKASTRTRLSFEVAVHQLGGQTIFMTPHESQLGRSEPLRDTARVISRYADCIVVRTFGQEKVEELVRYADVPVVNALTDSYHPCQVLCDVMTMTERTPDLSGVKVAWIGDGNNMANSWISAAARFPFALTLACPEGYDPDAAVLAEARAQGARVDLVRDPYEAADGAHYVNTDVWASMGQEAEQKEREAAFAGFIVDDELLARAAAGVKVMHCLPAHRGEEITDAVMEGPASIVFDQAENRLHIQKAILEWVMA